MDINKFFSPSKKQLFIGAFLVTLLTGIRSGHWSTGYIGGTGIGFPLLWWRNVTWTDVTGYIGNADRQFGIIVSILSLIGDLAFWFVILLIIRLFLKKRLVKNI